MNGIGIYNLKWIFVFSSRILGTGVGIGVSRLIFFELEQINCLWFSIVSGCGGGWLALLGLVVIGGGVLGGPWFGRGGVGVWCCWRGRGCGDAGLVAVPGRFCVLGGLGGGTARISFTILDIMFRFTCGLLYMY